MIKLKQNLFILYICFLTTYSEQDALGHGLESGYITSDYIAKETMKKVEDGAEAKGISRERIVELKAITATNFLWKFKSGQPRVIKVCFGLAENINHGKEVINDITKIAPEWLDGLNTKFDFGPTDNPYKCLGKPEDKYDFPIRVSTEYKYFTTPQYKSLIGNDSAAIDLQNTTYSMILPFKPYHDDWVTDKRKRFFILHEFGHALGFLHEHQRFQCKWSYPYLVSRGFFLSETEAKQKLEYLKYPTKAYKNNDGSPIETIPDQESIMKYNFESPFAFEDGESDECYMKKWTFSLSDYDKKGVKMAYKDNFQMAATAYSIQGSVNDLSILREEAPLVADLFSNKRFAISNIGDFAEFKKHATASQIIKAKSAVSLNEAELEVIRDALAYRATLLIPQNQLGNQQ